MPKYLLALLCFSLLACSTNDDLSDDEKIQNYLRDNNLQAQKTSSGLYYIIDEEGHGEKTQPTDRIRLKYHGQYTNGTTFEETHEEGLSFLLEFTIEGLGEGLGYFREGGKGKLIIPPSLAQRKGYHIKELPENRILIFDFELISINYKTKNDIDIQTYISENNINAQKTNSGLYYIITEEGTGNTPTIDNNITVDYKGYFTYGDVFDEREQITLDIKNLILGWQEGLTYFKEGGKGTLIIPAHLGYGNNGFASIPSGSVIIYDVNLISINQ